MAVSQEQNLSFFELLPFSNCLLDAEKSCPNNLFTDKKKKLRNEGRELKRVYNKLKFENLALKNKNVNLEKEICDLSEYLDSLNTAYVKRRQEYKELVVEFSVHHEKYLASIRRRKNGRKSPTSTEMLGDFCFVILICLHIQNPICNTSLQMIKMF